MLAKERVFMTLNHKEPDRVPIDYSATPETDKNLCIELGLSSHEELLHYFSVDFRYVIPKCKINTYGSYFCDPLIEALGNGIFKDIWGITFKKINYGLGAYFECIESPLAKIQNIEDLEDFEVPDVHKIWDFSSIKSEAEKYKDFAVVFNGASLLQFCQPLRGMQQLLLDLKENPSVVRSILKKVVDYWIKYGTSLLEAANGLIDIIIINDDYGTQNGPMFNPEIWRKYIKPLVWETINSYKAYNVKIIFHSCGGIYPFIEDFIEMGVDILDPIQVLAKNMSPRKLKVKYGKMICFRGAIDTQYLLPFGTMDEIKYAVRSTINDLAGNGGYIFKSVHNLQPDVPPENIYAMYDAVLEYGKYPI